MPDMRVCKAGDDITATPTIEEGRKPPQGIAVYLNLAQLAQPESLTNIVSNPHGRRDTGVAKFHSSPPVNARHKA